MKLTAEKVFENASISLVNTRQNRFRDVHPKVENLGQRLLLTLGKNESASKQSLYLDFTDEAILHLILMFRYAPAWLVAQWLETKNTIDIAARERIRSLIDFGLVYEYPTAIGVFLMPTNLTAGLFNEELGSFRDPSYNILTHEVSEMDLLFKLIMGRYTFHAETKPFPYVSQFFGTQSGSQSLTEHSYSRALNASMGTGRSLKTEEVEKTVGELLQEIKIGKQITTADMKEKKLAIYKKNGKGSYDVKVPDIAILAPRKVEDGIAKPQSVALEVELNPKRADKYIKALELYWDNLIYGKVVWLIKDRQTLKGIKSAYNTLLAKKKPTCAIEVINYEIPYNKNEII